MEKFPNFLFKYPIFLLDVYNWLYTHSSKRRMNNYVNPVNSNYENVHMGKQFPPQPKKKKRIHDFLNYPFH